MESSGIESKKMIARPRLYMQRVLFAAWVEILISPVFMNNHASALAMTLFFGTVCRTYESIFKLPNWEPSKVPRIARIIIPRPSLPNWPLRRANRLGRKLYSYWKRLVWLDQFPSTSGQLLNSNRQFANHLFVWKTRNIVFFVLSRNIIIVD